MCNSVSYRCFLIMIGALLSKCWATNRIIKSKEHTRLVLDKVQQKFKAKLYLAFQKLETSHRPLYNQSYWDGESLNPTENLARSGHLSKPSVQTLPRDAAWTSDRSTAEVEVNSHCGRVIITINRQFWGHLGYNRHLDEGVLVWWDYSEIFGQNAR